MLNLQMHHILKREFWKADVARILEGIAAVPVAAAILQSKPINRHLQPAADATGVSKAGDPGAAETCGGGGADATGGA